MYIRIVLWIGLLAGLLWSTVEAKPLMYAEGKGDKGLVRIVVTDEPCADDIGLKATWTENKNVVNGCYGVAGTTLVFIWADKTISTFPVNVFKLMTGI